MDERYWTLWVDDTPVTPEVPLTLEEAINEFRVEVGQTDDAKVEIRQCEEYDLRRAGIAVGGA